MMIEASGKTEWSFEITLSGAASGSIHGRASIIMGGGKTILQLAFKKQGEDEYTPAITQTLPMFALSLKGAAELRGYIEQNFLGFLPEMLRQETALHFADVTNLALMDLGYYEEENTQDLIDTHTASAERRIREWMGNHRGPKQKFSIEDVKRERDRLGTAASFKSVAFALGVDESTVRRRVKREGAQNLEDL